MIARLRKDQKGVAIVEYIIVLAIVAAIAATLFGGTNAQGLRGALFNLLGSAIRSINSIINN